MSIRYIGSKARIAEQILDHVGPPSDSDGVFIDGFAGTGAVARAAAEAGWPVRVNDSLLSATALSTARLASEACVDFASLGGYVSAVKWVVSLEATRFDRAQPYWTSSTSAAALRNRPPPPDLRSPPLTDQVKCPRRSPSAHP